MSKINIADYTVYRYRYLIGYGLIAIVLISVLVFAGFFLPGGISTKEMQSVVISNSIDFSNLNSLSIVNLPYHVLQYASLSLLGVSIISIKLPSIVLAFITIISAIILLRIWFKPSVSILVALIAISTGQFLFMAQDGTPDGMSLVWSVLLLLIASIISKTKKLRKSLIILFALLATLSLYTPLSAYALIALVSAIIIHPHLRYLIKQIPNIEIVIGTIVSLILVAPLIASVVKNPSLGLTLMGIPIELPNITNNITTLGAQYLGFNKPGGTTSMTPFFELGTMLLIALGAYAVVKNHSTAKSHIIAIWSIMLVPIVIINPSLAIVNLFPMVLLLAKGINKLMSYWYDLFPHNPYARIGGLIPIVILVLVLVLSGADRYAYGYRYNPNIVPSFSHDLKLIPDDIKNLVTSDSELDFYKVVETRNKTFKATTSPVSDNFLSTRQAKGQYNDFSIKKIITNSNNKDGDRFYQYTKNSQ